MTKPPDHPYTEGDEKTSYGALKNSCLKCGRMREWHAQQSIPLKSAEELAKEWLEANGFKNHPFYPSGLHLLRRYIEDMRKCH